MAATKEAIAPFMSTAPLPVIKPPTSSAENGSVFHPPPVGTTSVCPAKQKFGEDPRKYSISSKEILRYKDGSLKGILTVKVDSDLTEIPDSAKVWEADLIFIAMGFLQPEHYINSKIGLEIDARGNFLADKINYRTSVEKIYAAADCRRGQDLVVRAINEGREAAREIDRDIMGVTDLP